MNQKVFTWISGIVSLLYLAFGAYLIFFSPMYFSWQKAFGGIIIAYGLFRFYRIYRLYLKSKEYNDNEG